MTSVAGSSGDCGSGVFGNNGAVVSNSCLVTGGVVPNGKLIGCIVLGSLVADGESKSKPVSSAIISFFSGVSSKPKPDIF